MPAPGVCGGIGKEDQAHAGDIPGIGVALTLFLSFLRIRAGTCTAVPAEDGRALAWVGFVDDRVGERLCETVFAEGLNLVTLPGAADVVADVPEIGPLDRPEVRLIEETHRDVLAWVPAVVGFVWVDLLPFPLEDGALVIVPGDSVSLDREVLLQPVVVDGRLVQDGCFVVCILYDAEIGGPRFRQHRCCQHGGCQHQHHKRYNKFFQSSHRANSRFLGIPDFWCVR